MERVGCWSSYANVGRRILIFGIILGFQHYIYLNHAEWFQFLKHLLSRSSKFPLCLCAFASLR